MGSHTRVPPWGKTISTRVVTSKLRHFSAWRGLKGSCCASASFGNAAAAGRIAPVFRKARLSMSVLLSIEGLAHDAGPGVPAHSAWSARYWLLRKAEKLGRESCRRAEGERGGTAAVVDITVGTPSSARARWLREADHHRERTRAARSQALLDDHRYAAETDESQS